MTGIGGPVVGVDEVGRGPLAGPVVVAAVILEREIPGLADSKVLSPAARTELARLVRRHGRVALAAASVGEIERLNILGATLLAMRRAVLRLGVRPGLVLVDGNRGPALDCEVRCIVGGDATVPAISAASIVAKVTRDALMARLARRHPGYGWERNAGYPTREHLAALARLGLNRHHRRSFGPCAALRVVPVDGDAAA
jgi:ribonuclease HII